MAEEKLCPLCGKLIDGDKQFCINCQHSVDNQYTTDLLNTEDQVKQVDTDSVNDEMTETVMVDETEMVEKQPAKRKGVSRGLIFILIGCLILVGVVVAGSIKVISDRNSLEEEELYWNNCIEENTPVSYSRYIVTFPEGIYTEEANNRIKKFRDIEIQTWAKLKVSSEINDFYAYLEENPKTQYIDQIRFLMDSLSWLTSVHENTPEAYQAYLNNVDLGNLSGNYVEVAQKKFNYLSQIKMIEGASLDSLKTQIDQIFVSLSGNDPKVLLKLFAPQVSYNNQDTVYSNTDIVSEIQNYLNAKKIKSIAYTSQKKSILAKKDNLGIVFLDLVVDKEIVYNEKVKVGRKMENKKEMKTDTFNIELNKEKQIQMIWIKPKKATLK